MSGWTEAFIVIAAVAIVMQMAIMLGMYLQFRDMNQHIKRVTTDLETRVNPILLRINRILDDSQDRISSIVGDAAEVTRIARSQAQKVDRVFTDAVDRLRVQVIRADHLLTGALEVLEDTGSKVRRTVTGPITQVTAVLKGIKVGLDFIRGQQHHRRRSDAPTQDEELFI
jgi:type IV secretory pathway VirB2 component (pilin)